MNIITLPEKYPDSQTNDESGYTLVEHIVALSILSIIFLLIMPLSLKRIDDMTHKQYLKLFSNDILYTQNLAFHYPTDDVRLQFNKNNYTLLIGHRNRVRLERQFPAGWEINHHDMNIITFNKSGTVLEPGTMVIQTQSATYDIILPLGKGRERIVKQ